MSSGKVPWPRACARARGVKRGEAAVLVPREAVIDVARVNVISRGGPRRGDAGPAYRALEGACTRAWNIECSDGAVRGAHEAVIDVARIKVRSRESPAELMNPGKVP